jgi:seryl-tRNA synthetase
LTGADSGELEMADAEMRAALTSLIEMAKVQAETVETLGKLADQHRGDAQELRARLRRIERHLEARTPAESPASTVDDVLRGAAAEKAPSRPAKLVL